MPSSVTESLARLQQAYNELRRDHVQLQQDFMALKQLHQCCSTQASATTDSPLLGASDATDRILYPAPDPDDPFLATDLLEVNNATPGEYQALAESEPRLGDIRTPPALTALSPQTHPAYPLSRGAATLEDVATTGQTPLEPIVTGQSPEPGPETQLTGLVFNEVVRNKEARKQLLAVECTSCQEFYEACGSLQLPDAAHRPMFSRRSQSTSSAQPLVNPLCSHHYPSSNNPETTGTSDDTDVSSTDTTDSKDPATGHLAQVSRHRYKVIPKAFPEDYWDIGFPGDPSL
ncbi:hypothetical protein H4R33_000491 [Dimargaris cristalligena]|uniref:DNA endonuclease activator Ctp1 C-terminal domain-containing protein n=1 Tax=Dimargaris cristalligena TaxID=215637 RepID=A0A4P9ZUY7_9FUNG|nr:hypothetical protein H4R33_000491 [Dimargaris cristalligena]RKP37426.1 hypothetical protein BJ085DRAFT_40186 [Dimargaris cristalligena]|eukprot:RKP37426.1 hypothetical protein BJ085DRAFT_40186 [Dimargaris cristalligena]